MPVHKTLLVAALILASAPGMTEGKTWYVPSGVPTIKAAVDSCKASGDAISITGGVYREGSIVIDGKSISITQNGQVTVIAPVAGTGTFITYRNGSAGQLWSLVIRNFDTAIAVEGGSPSITAVSLKACRQGLAVTGSSAPQFTYSVVDSCTTAISIEGGSPVLQNETIALCGTGVSFLGGTTNMTRSIVYGCVTGVQCAGGSAALGCNDFWANGSDYSGCAAGTNDFYLDPRFCFWASSGGPYQLHNTSPCFDTTLNPCHVKIGALSSGSIPGCSGTAVERSTWGSIKSIYR